jgi:hypothetical protein
VADWAVDGNPNTRWASDGPNDAEGPNPEWQWLELDLGGARFIDSINLQWERAYSRDYEIRVSDYGVSWETVRTFPNGIGGEVEVSMLDVTARYVRIFSTVGDSNYGISLYQVKIFGDSSGDCVVPTTCRQTGIDAAAAVASSEESSHFGPEKAIDNDYSTRWSSEFRDGESITVDLGELTLVYSVWLFWERAYAGSYQLQTGDSLVGPWTMIVEIDDSDGEVDILDGLDVVTQYVRLLSTDRATRYGNSLWEFEVRGTQEEGCAGP